METLENREDNFAEIMEASENREDNLAENMKTLKEHASNLTEVMQQKIYKACLDMILGPDELPENVKYIFINLDCHVPLEQFLYDMIFLYGKNGKPRQPQDFLKKSAALYYIHSKLNEKLDRSYHLRNHMQDDFLLYCILSEAKNRKLDVPNISEDLLKDQIYHKFQNTDYRLGEGEFIAEDMDDRYDNFDDYIKFLFTKRRNGLMEINSFNYLWSRLRIRRDKTFFCVRPTQNELYVFCFALGLDYDTYCRLRRLLEKEWAESSEAERKIKFRKTFEGFTDTERDVVLRGYLEVIGVRLECAKNEVNGREDFIPGRMLHNVDEDLSHYRTEKGEEIKPLTKKIDHGNRKGGRKVVY